VKRCRGGAEVVQRWCREMVGGAKVVGAEEGAEVVQRGCRGGVDAEVHRGGGGAEVVQR